jgi:uncharacterized protein (DUF1501 family)
MPQDESCLSRRDWHRLATAGLLSGLSVPWFESLARAAAVRRPRGKACILLWMDGGPSQQHTFDPKPGGEFRPAKTSVPGIHIVEQLPQLAQCMGDMALLRSMRTGINDHYDAKYQLHTGFRRVTGLEHPCLGSIASHQLGDPSGDMPAFVTIDAGFDLRVDGGRLYRNVPGYLGPKHAPLAVNEPARGLENLKPAASSDLDARLELLKDGERGLADDLPLPAVKARQSAHERAVALMRSKRARAFDVSLEPEKVREEYGKHRFGQSCLLARRLVESGVNFVEVFHRGWDDHNGAARNMVLRAPWLDKAMATLIRDLKRRGMLDDTLVVWMGEFGRTPGDGNGHFSQAWSTMWAGGGINTGLVIGKTSDTGKTPGNAVTERPISAQDYVATLCLALGIDTHQELMAPGNRPMPLVEAGAKPIKELLR